MKKAVFLDRDGTLVREVEFLSRREDMELLPGVAYALARLGKAGYLRLIVSNQSGVARGYFDGATQEQLNDALRADLQEQGADVEGVAFCPHHPDYSGPCACRKPEPGLLLELSERLGVDLAASWMVGDKVSDVGAGRNAGCRTVLVRTGYGSEEEIKLAERGLRADLVVDDLKTFVAKLLGAEPPTLS